MNNKPTQILKQHVSKEYDLQQPVTKIDKEVGPELDNNMSCSSSQIYLNNTITAGGGDLSQDEPSTNLYHPSMLYHNNDYSKSKSTASSPHYLVNKNQFSIRSPRLPIPSNTNRIFPSGIGGKENPKLLLNINTNNNQQVFNSSLSSKQSSCAFVKRQMAFGFNQLPDKKTNKDIRDRFAIEFNKKKNTYK